MSTIRITTIQAPNQEFIIQELSAYIARRLGITTEFLVEAPWQERERLLDAGQVEIAWICGLPYVWKAELGTPELELLVAPVMQGERYQDRPIYYSDVIMRRESRYERFEDLRGGRWAYNEPHSHSGYNVTRHHLAGIGAERDFFATTIESGSHERSIEMVIDGIVDASAIDSTVLELARDTDDRIRTDLRVLTSLGPSPIPPLVILKRVEDGLREDIRKALVEMHLQEEGRRILDKGKIKRLQAVRDEDYDPIRKMALEAKNVRW
ncbi:MAG TPA: PhnD/SsuA/transferrin family substrate-binding protein [Anaerolineales bacterium]|nr:PhnD/SsuA/transferrin family substrate-binding protein [Anaerolineales bacterium]